MDPPSVSLDDSVTLTCNAIGQQRVNFEWRKANGELPQNSQILQGGKVLRISRVSTNSGGRYICVATTPRGSYMKEIALTIQSKLSLKTIYNYYFSNFIKFFLF